MYLNYLTNIIKQSVLHLMPALAVLSSDCDVVNNDVEDSSSVITEKDIDNFVLAALNSVESAANSVDSLVYIKQDNAQLREIISFLQNNIPKIKQTPDITQTLVDLNYLCRTGTVFVDVDIESNVSAINWVDCGLHSVLGLSLMHGVPANLYSYINYGALTYSYNNMFFLHTDYFGDKSSVINGNKCCKGWQTFNMEDDVCIDNLNLTDTMFISNGDVYIYSDKSVVPNDNGTINVSLSMKSVIFGALKLTATDILFETCCGRKLPISGEVIITGEDVAFFSIRFNGNSNFIVTFEGIEKTVNWIDIVKNL